MTERISSIFYAGLIETSTSPRLKASLERVKAACDFFDSVTAEITPTRVGKFCEDRWGGPKMQSIRNAHDTLFKYLNARRAEQILKPTARKESARPVIRDETVRAYVEIIETERDEAVKAKNRIIAGLRTIPGIPVDDFIARGHKGLVEPEENNPASAADAATLSIAAKEAIARLFDAEALNKVGLELFRQRLRNKMTKEILLDKKMVDALLPLVDISCPAPEAAPAQSNAAQRQLS
jgi:hypothetical protein